MRAGGTTAAGGWHQCRRRAASIPSRRLEAFSTRLDETIQDDVHRTRIILSALLTCASLLAGASPALASHDQAMFFEAPSELLNPQTRPQAIAQLRSLGVHALHVVLSWHEVAPDPESATKPSFQASNPASYHWGAYDELLAEAKRLHWQVLLTVSSPVPRWATSNRSAPYVTRPDQRDFEQFMIAVARQYRSEVSLFAIWNEPNHPEFLRPQFTAKGWPASPRIYRGLFQAGYEGLRAGGISHPKVLMGETGPIGYDHVPPRFGPLHDVAPIDFLRGALCLNSRWQRAPTCGSLPAFGYAHHAYAAATGPFEVPQNPDDVTIGVLSRLRRALSRAAKAHALTGDIPIFLTEFGVQSKPNNLVGVSPAKQAEFDAIAERIAWEDPQVAAFSQYLLEDDSLTAPPGVGAHGYVGFQTGLEYANGSKKPLYFGFPVPMTVTKRKHGFALWGGVLPARKATKVTILAQVGHSKRYRPIAHVRTNGRGWWQLKIKAKALHWRVLWHPPHGQRYEGPPVGAYRFVR